MDLDLLSKKIAATILSEEFEDEKSKQDDIEKAIKAQNLDAPEGSKDKETITDEAEDEEDSGEKKGVKAKPKPDPEPDDDEESFEVEATKNPPEDPTVEDIEDQINNLRAGKSLKDDAVSSELKDYFEKLGQAEERSLYVFLSSLAAILTGGTPGAEAPRPETMGVDIEMKRREKSRGPEGSMKPSVSLDGEQAPIMVGEVSDTTAYKMMVLEGHGPGDQHRCLDGRRVKFGSRDCIRDVKNRISDTISLRDDCGTGTADRASLNGVLKFLRQKLRAANKIYSNR
jgi:hypothetical protein